MVTASRLRFPREDPVPNNQFLRMKANFKEGIKEEITAMVPDNYKKIAFFSLPKSELRPLKLAGDCSVLFRRYATAHSVDINLLGNDTLMLRAPCANSLRQVVDKISTLFHKYAALDIPVTTKACWVCPIDGIADNDRVSFPGDGGKMVPKRGKLNRQGSDMLALTANGDPKGVGVFVKLVAPFIKMDFVRLFELQVKCKIRVQFGLLKILGVAKGQRINPNMFNLMLERKSGKLKPRVYPNLGDFEYWGKLVKAAENFNNKHGMKDLHGDPTEASVFDTVVLMTTDGDRILLLVDGNQADRNSGDIPFHGILQKSEPMVTSKAIACACTHRGADFNFTFESDDTEDMTVSPIPVFTQALCFTGNRSETKPYNVTWNTSKNLDVDIKHVEIITTRRYTLRNTSYIFVLTLTRRWNGPTSQPMVAMETGLQLYYDEWDREVSTPRESTKTTVNMKAMFNGSGLGKSYEEGLGEFMKGVDDILTLIETAGEINS